MREFKFRYWDTADGNWEKKFSYFDLEPRKDSPSVGCGMIILPLDRANRYVIQQFTGIEDKNGKEICEGDLIKDLQGWIYQIFWLDTSASFELSAIKEYEVSHLSYHTIFNWRDMLRCEVVGNIFENPELLK